MASILIVEDDGAAANSLGQHLKGAGHTCRHERDAEAALKFALANSPDLIILDVMLPGISGFELCRRIRRDENLYTTLILIISAMNAEEEIMHGIAQGADDYIPKPYSLNQLLSRVDSLLRSKGSGHLRDEITNLPGNSGTRREIQRRISVGKDFALVYVEIVNLRDFTKRAGGEAREKAIRHAGRALERCGEQLNVKQFFAGHMGGGHFVCLMPPADAVNFANLVIRVWDRHVKTFYESVGEEALYNEAQDDATKKAGHVTLQCCITAKKPKGDQTPEELFETISHVRANIPAGTSGGVHIDKRAHIKKSTAETGSQST